MEEKEINEARSKANAKMRAWRAKNPDKVLAARLRNRDKVLFASRRWWANLPPERKLFYSRKNEEIRFRLKYGITKGQVEEKRREIGGMCQICGNKTKLVVDHCHSTGKFRGLLCRGCNCGIGHFRDSIQAMSSAIEYIKKTKH